MKLIVLFLSLLFASHVFAQTYEDFIGDSYDFLEKNDLPAAEEALRAAMRLEPANPFNYALLTNLGTIQRRQGKKEDALLSYTTALSRRPDDILLLANRASLYGETGDAEKAIADYNTILSIDNVNQDALYYRGLLYIQLRNLVEAEADFDRMLQINEKTLNGRVGHAILAKVRGNYDESERIYNYLISEMPQVWTLYEGRAELYFMMEKNARAIDDLNKVLSATTPAASFYILRAKIKIAQYERQAAREDLQKAAEMGYPSEIIAELRKLCD